MEKLLLLFLTVYTVSALPTLENVKHEGYPRYITFPGGDGIPRLVDLEEPVDEELLAHAERSDDINRYVLFTRQNRDNSQELTINDVDSVQQSFFNPERPTAVVVHGWLSKSETSINPAITNAYLNNFDVNIIIVDWRSIAISGYVTAASGVPAVGRHLGRFMAFLNSLGAPYETMHLIGFSLGAHVVGNAGREVGGRIARITGLDPAGPLWVTSNQRISPNDGVYVEAIHTDGGYTVGGAGIGMDVAQVDFYPNGGLSQPGCLTNVCHHNRSWELFAATVSYNHLIGNECTSSTQINLNLCRGNTFPMGNGEVQKSGSGRYRVNTGRRYPY